MKHKLENLETGAIIALVEKSYSKAKSEWPSTEEGDILEKEQTESNESEIQLVLARCIALNQTPE